MSATAAKPRERKHLGWLEDYWTADGKEWLYAGHRAVQETAQGIGSQNRQKFVLPETIEINRSFTRKRILKAGTLVRRLVSPLQGRAL